MVAPHYQPWKVDTLDGRSRTGLLVRTYLDECTYIDAKGDPFKVTAAEVVEATPAKSRLSDPTPPAGRVLLAAAPRPPSAERWTWRGNWLAP